MENQNVTVEQLLSVLPEKQVEIAIGIRDLGYDTYLDSRVTETFSRNDVIAVSQAPVRLLIRNGLVRIEKGEEGRRRKHVWAGDVEELQPLRNAAYELQVANNTYKRAAKDRLAAVDKYGRVFKDARLYIDTSK